MLFMKRIFNVCTLRWSRIGSRQNRLSITRNLANLPRVSTAQCYGVLVEDKIKLPTSMVFCTSPQGSHGIEDIATYNRVAEETLESLCEHFEELLANYCGESDADVTLSNGVLTLNLGTDKGTYVINKQTPNRQIWFSSPLSGPKRYDFLNGQWIYRHDGLTLHQLLDTEMSNHFNRKLDFSHCAYAMKS